MNKSFSNILFILLIAWFVSGCVESEFHLAKESRLPVWFEIPDGMQREELDVVLTYYTSGPADLVLRDIRKGKSLKRIKAKNIHHPEYWVWAQKDWPKRSHPAYVVLSVGDISEIIEHRKMEPIFYVSDESSVQISINSENTHNKRLQIDAAMPRD